MRPIRDRGRRCRAAARRERLRGRLGRHRHRDHRGRRASTTAAGGSTTTVTTSIPGTTVTPTSLEQALTAWAAGSGSTYLGVCPQDFDAAFPLDGLCSVELEDTAGRSVQGLGPPFSEIVAYVLLEEGAAGWAVADEYAPTDPFDLGDAPGWVPQG